MKFINNCAFINKMLLASESYEIREEDSFLVHSDIYPMVQKYLTRSGVNDLQHLGSYELTVGAYTFDMEILVMGTRSASSSFPLFKNILWVSQFTYFWDSRITLFREVDRYYELEEFIAINKLNKHVVSIEEIAGVNSLGQPIKLVTFDSTKDEIQRDELLANYEEFLRSKSLSATAFKTCHYYFTKSLPWQTSKMFHMHSSPFLNHRIFLELQTFLTCMRELTYTREPHLDLISLCSLKLAFCDELNLTEASSDLEFEIDALIERFLRRMVKNQTYIQNGEFDLYRYASDTNTSVINDSYLAVHDLVYTFQHIFHCTNIYGIAFNDFMFLDEVTRTLTLVDENKCLKILRDRSKIPHKVDGQNYNIDSKEFCELLKCRNVEEIVLDTDYQWINEPYLTESVGFYRQWILIVLVGTNEFNFVEDFIQFLNTMPSSVTSTMVLRIKVVTIKSFNIFKNLEIERLEFYGLKITFTMLTELLECDLMDLRIIFNKCTIEDKSCTWSLLINGFNREYVEIEILEEEKTFQYLFESIANHLTKSKLNEFNFKCELGVMYKKFVELLSVSRLKFKFDEFNTRLEMQDESGQAIDLYDWKNTVDESEDDYKNFEFYQ